MADSIRVKGGSGAVPSLADRELAYSKTEEALYIGTKNGNVKLCDAAQENRIKAYIDIFATNINIRLDELSSRIAALENPSE